jgi:hypothetical protein
MTTIKGNALINLLRNMDSSNFDNINPITHITNAVTSTNQDFVAKTPVNNRMNPNKYKPGSLLCSQESFSINSVNGRLR